MFSKSEFLSSKMLRYFTEPQPYWLLEKFREKWVHRHLFVLISVAIGILSTLFFLLMIDNYIGAAITVFITTIAVALIVKSQKKSDEKWLYIELCTDGILIIGWALIGLTIAYFLLAVDNYVGTSVIVLITVVATALEVKALIYLVNKVKNHRETL